MAATKLCSNHYLYVQQYIMSTGHARRSQLTISFSFTKKQWPTKQTREDLEETRPIIIVNSASAATIIDESFNRNQNFITASPITIHSIYELALNLSLLKEKNTPSLSYIKISFHNALKISLF